MLQPLDAITFKSHLNPVLLINHSKKGHFGVVAIIFYFHVFGSSSNLSLIQFDIMKMKAVRPAPVPRIDPAQ